MSSDSKIQWTDATWNPVRGCSRVSPGCENCYAERHGARFAGPGLRYDGFVRIGQGGPRWTGRVELVPGMLDRPLRWRRPRRIFVNSLSDLFHEALSDKDIAAVFGVMAAAPQHTFQVLTKRAERMRAWFKWIASLTEAPDLVVQRCAHRLAPLPLHAIKGTFKAYPWPLPNVHLGVSVEDQQRADERIPLLLETPAAVRFVSYEPALGPVRFEEHTLGCVGHLAATFGNPLINWLIVGGESGPGARPFDLAWARSAIEQCRAAGVPVFVKQLGRNIAGRDCEHGRAGETCRTTDPKGGDPAEWPEDLRVREFPRAITPTTGDEHGNANPQQNLTGSAHRG